MHSADLKTSKKSPQRTIKLDDGPLRIEDIIDIAEGSARVGLSDSHEFCAGIARGADFLDRCCAKRVRSMVSPPVTAIRAP